MNSRNQLRFTMVKVAMSYLDDHKALWSGRKAFSSKMVKILDNTQTIEALVPQTLAGTQSSTQQKRQYKESMLQTTLYLIAAGRSYAADTQNAELESHMSFSLSDLQKGTHMVSLGLCRNNYTFLLPYSEKLGDYDATPENFVAQNEACNACEEAISKPVKTRKDIMAANQKLAMLLDQTIEIFTAHIDPFVKMLAATQPDFYAGYKIARKIGGAGKAKTDEPVDPGTN